MHMYAECALVSYSLRMCDICTYEDDEIVEVVGECSCRCVFLIKRLKVLRGEICSTLPFWNVSNFGHFFCPLQLIFSTS